MMPSSLGQTERRASSCMVRMAPCPMDRPRLRPGAHERRSYSQPPGLSVSGEGWQCRGPVCCQAGSHTSHFSGQLFSQHLLPHHPQPELLAPASRGILQEPLNKAVNEEVSSLYPSGSHPPPKYPHLRASFFQTPPCSEGGPSQLPWHCCCSQDTRTARLGCVPHTWAQNQAPPAS